MKPINQTGFALEKQREMNEKREEILKCRFSGINERLEKIEEYLEFNKTKDEKKVSAADVIEFENIAKERNVEDNTQRTEEKNLKI